MSEEIQLQQIIDLFRQITDGYRKSYMVNHLLRCYGTPDDIMRLSESERLKIINELEMRCM